MPETRPGILAWAALEGDVGLLHKEMFGGAFRRIGTYVKLAQVGAVRCAGDLDPALRREMGVFLGSGLGNTVDIVPLMEGILGPRRTRTSPMAFAGCVGNAAAFFVAQALGVLGPNVTLSQEDLSFEAALLEAVLALRAGTVTHALVGGVDVHSGSDEEQRERLDALGVPGAITQGAGFLLLGPGDGAPAHLDEVWLGRTSVDGLLSPIPAGVRVLPGWRLHHLKSAEPAETRLLPVAAGLRVVDGLSALDGPGAFAHVQRTPSGLAARIRVSRS